MQSTNTVATTLWPAPVSAWRSSSMYRLIPSRSHRWWCGSMIGRSGSSAVSDCAASHASSHTYIRRTVVSAPEGVVMTVEMLACGYGLIEGPRAAPDGSLYFSDVHNGGVRRLLPGGDIELVVPKRRGVGGIALHADGG